MATIKIQLEQTQRQHQPTRIEVKNRYEVLLQHNHDSDIQAKHSKFRNSYRRHRRETSCKTDTKKQKN